MWHIYAIEYYLATKEKEILSFATTCMDPEDIMGRELRLTYTKGRKK